MRRAFAVLVFAACIVLCSLVCCAAEAADIESSFRSFGDQWIAVLNASAAKKVSCREVDGKHMAEYTSYSQPSELTVRQTGQQASPYVGVLKYQQQACSCRAITAEAALKGPFSCSVVCPVTAIFLYKNGQWQY
jgi:hypothetical protein